ncbi:MAG: hypothetical protein K8R85_04415 [Bacteroidetes bacterium]|nr:hypothetical protein [Bacteroidota bacterium]
MKKKEQNKTDRTLAEIREQLIIGDQILIAKILECTSNYVSMVLREDRKSERVLAVANEVIDNRDELIKRLMK